jgi:Ca2+-binding RTX toxin-like protein
MRLTESLESRRLLTATLENGVLTVTGTGNADFIAVRPVPGAQLAVYEGRPTTSTFPALPPTLFPARSVNSIVVNGLGGDDSIAVHAVKPSADPTLVAPIAIPTTINGGAGNDRIVGNVGNDVISGDEGNDFIDGNRGDDDLSGGDGRDRLRGGPGADEILGGNNNDFIDARDRAGSDTVDGGAHDPAPTATNLPAGDVAVVDVGDAVTNVETVYTFPRPTGPSVKFATTGTIGGEILTPGGTGLETGSGVIAA